MDTNYKDVRHRKNEYSHIITGHTLYESFIAKYPDYNLTKTEFQKLYGILMMAYRDEVCTNPQGVKLPFHMGDISQKYVITTKLNSIKLKKDLKKDIEYVNLSTNGRQGKLIHGVKQAQRFNETLRYIGFSGTRDFKIQVGKSFKDKPELYMMNKSNSKGIIKKYKLSKGDQ